MSRLDLKFLWHHPLRWGRAVGFHLAIAALLLTNAILVTDPLWDVTAWSHLGPVVLSAAAGVVIASAVAPADRRLQIATMLTLLGTAVWRTSTYMLLAAADTSSLNTAVAEAFALHWIFVGAVATRWPIISTQAALVVTVEAGRDQGPLRAAG